MGVASFAHWVLVLFFVLLNLTSASLHIVTIFKDRALRIWTTKWEKIQRHPSFSLVEDWRTPRKISNPPFKITAVMSINIKRSNFM